MKLISNAKKAFPGLFYWMRLPGFVAFCGVAAGICAARVALAAAPESVPIHTLLYTKLLILAVILSAAAGVLFRRPLFRAGSFAVCGLALFAGAELGLREFYQRMDAVCENTQIFTLTARISSPVASTNYGNRFRGRIVGAEGVDVERALSGRTLQFTSRGPVPPYGVVTVQGRYTAPRRAAGPLGYDQREYYAVSNIHGNFFISRILDDGSGGPVKQPSIQDSAGLEGRPPAKPPKGSLTESLSYNLRITVHKVINKASSKDARAIFHAAFLSEKELLSAELRTVFRKSGIVHLLSISGFHAMLLYSAVFAAFGLAGVPHRYRTLLSLLVLWGYLFFIGFSPPIFRATVMATFFCVSTALQRRNHGVHSLGLAGALWLCVSPHSLFSSGFQLSFAATAGIIMLVPVLNALTHAVNSKIRNKPLEFIAGQALSPLWISIATFATTAPPLLHHFGTMSLYGILFNLIAIPMMSAAMWMFFAALVLSPIGILSGCAVWGADLTLRIMIYLSELCEYVPFSEVVFPKTTALQLFVMTAFMAGLCAIRKDLRGKFALRAGAAATLAVAVSSLYITMKATTENLEFTGKNSKINVIIYKDNSAWIAAQGRKNEIRQLRQREIESLLYLKKINRVPLFIINEEAEEEAHEFTFSTNFTPQIIVTATPKKGSSDRRKSGDGNDDSYTRVDIHTIVSPTGACSLRIGPNGRVDIFLSRE